MAHKSKQSAGTGEQRTLSRRQFLTMGLSTAAAAAVVPRHVIGGVGYQVPSDTLNLAVVGVGGRGKAHLDGLRSENIAVLCDVDEDYAADVFRQYPGAKKYTDYRIMLEQEKGLDGISVATPDHTHAVIAMAAMELGKHVYVEKPLTHTIYEVRKLTEAAHRYNVATQMGIQGHAMEGPRLINEWIWDGAIGTVREVHIWTDRPANWWPQGYQLHRPEEIPAVPSTLDWDLWVGPAPFRPYHPAYLPFVWRGWQDFGTGSLGDMACHLLDSPKWALNLGAPKYISASSTPMNDESYPSAQMIHYEFPAKGDRPAVELTWYDGGLMPTRPPELEPGRMMGNQNGGVLYVGEKGKIMASDENAQNPRIIPEARMREYQLPPKTIPRSIGHFKEWIEACKGGEPAKANFDYSGPLTEAVLLGNLAVRFQGQNVRLEWDPDNMKVSNVPEADQFITPEFRPGWSL